MLNPIKRLSAILIVLSAGSSYGWNSPGTGQLYTMDDASPKPPTDIAYATDDVVWDTVGNCYVIVDSVTISNWKSRDTLIVAPGTVVRFEPGRNLSLKIEGVFRAQGTESDTIVFTSNAVIPDTNDWKDLRFHEGSEDSLCVVSYCLIEYGRLGICCDRASPTISHNKIANSGAYGIVFDGSPTVSHNLIENSGGRGIGCGGASRAVVAGNILRNCYWRGIRCTDSASPLITENHVSGSTYIGIYCAGSASPTIVRNTIVDNGWGVVVDDSASPLVGGSLPDANDIYGSQFVELANVTTKTLKADYNFWGTVDRDSIEMRIRNYTEPGITDFAPWTNANHDVLFSEPPVADAGGSYHGQEGGITMLDGSESNDDGRIVLYEWDLDGDGLYDSSGVNVPHIWWDDHGGVVILRVTDDGALIDTDTTNVEIENVAPIADAGGPYSGDVGGEVQLSGSATDPGLDSFTFAWDLDGDGEFDDTTGQSTGHVWEAPGTYSICLQVTDDDGGAGVDSATVEIYHCGDCNGDDRITAADATYLVSFIYRSGPGPLGTADVNSDGRTTIADATYLIAFIYRGGPPLCQLPGLGRR